MNDLTALLSRPPGPRPSLRGYPRNSPEAAGRLLALALVANGRLEPSELEALARLRAPARLGLGVAQWLEVVDALCDDLIATANGDACRIDPVTLARLFAEVDDPALRHTVLQLTRAVIEADGRIEHGEATLLLAAMTRWLRDESHAPAEDAAPPGANAEPRGRTPARSASALEPRRRD